MSAFLRQVRYINDMTNSTDDDRSPLAVAMEWSARLMSIGLEIALPIAAGYWLDRRWHLSPVFVLLGSMLGFALGMLSLFQLARPRDSGKPK